MVFAFCQNIHTLLALCRKKFKTIFAVFSKIVKHFSNLVKKNETLFIFCRKEKHFSHFVEKGKHFSHFVKKTETFFATC